MRVLTVLILMLFACTAWSFQTTGSNSAPHDNLQAYISCDFGDKTAVEETAERSQPFLRPVGTGPEQQSVSIVHGFSLHIAYDETPFVNFKAERLTVLGYERDKRILVEDLTRVAANTPGAESPQPKKTGSAGFEIYSLNRTQLTGGVLSIYLLFRDIDETVVTLYFLNTPPESPKFNSLDQAHRLRDEFLRNYSSCVLKNLVH